jgi:hypothetical protein
MYLEIFGKQYYIDLDGITDKCRIIKSEPINIEEETDEEVDGGDEIIFEEEDTSTQINIFKFEIIKMCIDRILSEIDEVDEDLGSFGANKTSTSFKLAFNTLLKYEIIIENENE